jgi:O-glycosyl hydrolase
VAAVTIHWNDTHQVIDGFGTSQGGGFVGTLHDWPEPQRGQILDLAFSRAKGIGLTIFRAAILPELELSKGAWDDRNDPKQVWIMKRGL